jgi:hypothetical protein
LLRIEFGEGEVVDFGEDGGGGTGGVDEGVDASEAKI